MTNETEKTLEELAKRWSHYVKRDTQSYYPSGSAWPWTDEKWDSKDYLEFLKNAETKNISKLNFKDKELDKMEKFSTKGECHRYRLGVNKSLAFFDTFLILFDNILKILPVIMFSSLPLLILNNISSPNPGEINYDIVYWIYGIIVSAIIVSFVFRWIFKNELMIREQYIIAVNKREEDIVNQNKQ